MHCSACTVKKSVPRPCLLFGGIVFALLHGSPLDLAAGFCAGLAFTYLTYVFDTVWAAVLSHAAAAFVTVVMQWIADTYAPFGIWNILLPLTVLFFLLFAFLTLDTLGKNAGARFHSAL